MVPIDLERTFDDDHTKGKIQKLVDNASIDVFHAHGLK